MANLIIDTAVGTAAGYAGSQALSKTSAFFHKNTDPEKLQREKEIEPLPPIMVLVKKAEAILGVELDQKQEQKAAKYLDYALSIAMATLYVRTARRWPLSWFTGGVVFGTFFWAAWDEGISPALGLVGDNKKYPAEAHVRGLLSHVAFGLAAAAVARALGTKSRR
jgi:hypothetical protein